MSCSRTRLYRDPRNGKVGGVCAGIATKLDMEVWLVRIVVICAVLFMGPFTFIAYFVACLVLDKAPAEQVERQKQRKAHKVKQRHWQSGTTPSNVLQKLKEELDQQDKQLQAMEAYVTSSRFKVDREFSKL